MRALVMHTGRSYRGLKATFLTALCGVVPLITWHWRAFVDISAHPYPPEAPGTQLGPSGRIKPLLLFIAYLSAPTYKSRARRDILRERCFPKIAEACESEARGTLCRAKFFVGQPTDPKRGPPLPGDHRQGVTATDREIRIAKELWGEHDTFHDLVLIPMRDTYRDLSNKVIHILQYGLQVHAQNILKIDDDQCPNMTQVINTALETTSSTARYVGRHRFKGNEYPSMMTGPDGTTVSYMTGPGYLISSALARSIVIDDSARTVLFMPYGTSSEDNNMGRWFDHASRTHPELHFTKEVVPGLVAGVKETEKLVNCGQHAAPECLACPKGNGASWCNGECKWSNGTCIPAVSVLKDSDIAHTGGYNNAPFVIEQYRLLFFTTPKVSCSALKQLFRRIAGKSDWKTVDRDNDLHASHGLKMLDKYPLRDAEAMMTSPNWTRAIFIREPKQRLLSAFLDLPRRMSYVSWSCCDNKGTGNQLRNRTENEVKVCKGQLKEFAGFIKIVQLCKDEHWKRQADRLDPQHWKYINFVGHFESLADDTMKLLQTVGNGTAWEAYGKYGWGEDGSHGIFQGSKTYHATNASTKMSQYYTPALKKEVEEIYKADYDIFRVLEGQLQSGEKYFS